jgi:hypothetical protein
MKALFKTQFILVFLGLVICFTSLNGQITITKDDLPSIGTVNEVELDTSGVNVGALTAASGDNQTWDFSPVLNNVGQYSFQFLDPTATPFTAMFPDADQAALSYIDRSPIPAMPPLLMDRIDELIQPYNYLKIENDKVSGVGVELSLSLFSGAARFTQPSLVYPLPLTKDSNWIEKWQIDTTLVDSTLGAIPVSIIDSAGVSVDGWGTLNMNGSAYECLRIRYNWARRVLITFGGFQLEFIRWDRINYRWIAKDYGVILEVKSEDKETNPAFGNAFQVTRMKSSNVVVGIGCDPELCQDLPAFPDSWSLLQNYPNPFNPTTQIQYVLPQASRVEITVYSLLGRQITLLESGVKMAGFHETSWNGKNNIGQSLPSGTYFYRLKATPLNNSEPFIQTRKMILME